MYRDSPYKTDYQSSCDLLYVEIKKVNWKALSHLVPLAGETIWVNGKAMFSYLESQFWEKKHKGHRWGPFNELWIELVIEIVL